MLLFQKIITGQRRAGTQSIALLTMAQCILFTPKFYITMVFNFSWVLQSFQEKSKAMVIPFLFTRCIYDLGENGDCEGIRIP